MKYLVDSDYVAAYLKGRSEADQLLDLLAPEGLAISLITFGEVYEGIYYGRDPLAHEAGFRRFLRVVSVLSLNRLIMQRFGMVQGGFTVFGHEASTGAESRANTVNPGMPVLNHAFARIRGELRRKGQLIGDPDLLIAATALYHKLTLVTRNTRDFRRVPDLRLYGAEAARG